MFLPQCYDCTRDSQCGFCYSGQQAVCSPGNLDGPLNATSCDRVTWSYDACPSSKAWVAILLVLFIFRLPLFHGMTVFQVMLYLAFFASGIGPVPWTVNSEIYPLSVRSQANSVATVANWTTGDMSSRPHAAQRLMVLSQTSWWVPSPSPYSLSTSAPPSLLGYTDAQVNRDECDRRDLMAIQGSSGLRSLTSHCPKQLGNRWKKSRYRKRLYFQDKDRMSE